MSSKYLAISLCLLVVGIASAAVGQYFKYWGYPGQGRWEIYGMELPDEVLQKVYHKNAERIFAQFKGIAKAGDLR